MNTQQTALPSDNPAFWSRLAPRYDHHVLSREGAALAGRVANDLASVDSVLDVAAGTGRIAVEVARRVKQVHAVDLVPEMVQEALRKVRDAGLSNVELSTGHACALEFTDASFDAVVLANALHVMETPQRALAEAFRVLKPNGILVAPTFCHAQNLKAHVLSRLSSVLFGVRIHHRWNREGVVHLIRDAGFVPTTVEMIPFKVPLVYVVARKG